jgi:hypothetical protein
MSEPEEEHRCIVSILERVCGIDILDEEWSGEVDKKSGAPSILVWRQVSPISPSGAFTESINSHTVNIQPFGLFCRTEKCAGRASPPQCVSLSILVGDEYSFDCPV